MARLETCYVSHEEKRRKRGIFFQMVSCLTLIKYQIEKPPTLEKDGKKTRKAQKHQMNKVLIEYLIKICECQHEL